MDYSVIKTLTMCYFRKIIEDSMTFTPGINAIRGASEAGKSSRLEAISYAFFGAKGLSESLDDVVTYDQPASKLKVALTFDFAGVDYSLSRSKAGAELTFGKEIVTGQTEVTKFVERLFGVPADVASKLMIAKQKSLGGALSGGPREAGALIEDLAGISLIEDLILKVGDKLPSGNTAAAEARVSQARDRAQPVELVDFSEKEQKIVNLSLDVEGFEGVIRDLEKDRQKVDTLAATRVIQEVRDLQGAFDRRQAEIARLEAALAKPLEFHFDPVRLENLRQRAAEQKDWDKAQSMRRQLRALDLTVLWDEPLGTLVAAHGIAILDQYELQKKCEKAQDDLHTLDLDLERRYWNWKEELSNLNSQRISGDQCSLCQKDFKDIPEVARINGPIDLEIARVEARKVDKEALLAGPRKALSEATDELNSCKEHIRVLSSILDRSEKIQAVYDRAAEYITLDLCVVPAQWIWIGPPEEFHDYATELFQMESLRDLAIADKAQREAYQRLLEQLKADLVEVPSDFLAKAVLQQAVWLDSKIQQYRIDLAGARQQRYSLESDLNFEKKMQEEKVRAYEEARMALEDLEKDLREMQINNALVKKLRDARPKISDKLWSVVLSAVSVYFSEIRGEQTIVQRFENSFRANGHPVSGLSGSTQDALGLAVRLAMTKTFLPNIDFLILDEAAAACDDAREIAMLGLVATSGFSQTILISHSSLVDAFSDNVITLN